VVFSNFNTYDDYNPYIFKTTDYGKSWTNLSANFPQDQITRTIREDKLRKGLLFAGTETGVYYSLNDGQAWDKLKANLPSVPVVDMKIKDNDLVIATNGRGFWIMDDITPLREISQEVRSKSVHLYPISDHTRFGYNWWMDYFPGGDPGMKKNYFVQNMRPGLTFYELSFKPDNAERKRKFLDAGDPKPLGPVFYFKLNEEPTEIAIAILDKDGNEIRNYNEEEMMLNVGTGADFNTGLNKFVWDMRINGVTGVPGRPATTVIPIVPPGEYSVKLTVDGQSQSQDFNVFMNPKESYTQQQANDKFAFWMEMYDEAEGRTQKVLKAQAIKKEVTEKAEASGNKKAIAQAGVIAALVDGYEGAYVSTGRTLAEVINLPATILFKMSFMSGILDHSEGPVSGSMKTEFKELIEQADAVDNKFDTDLEKELRKFEKLIK
jgi:hypothetical protein